MTTMLVVIGIIGFLALTFAVQTLVANPDPNRIPVPAIRADDPQCWKPVLPADRARRQGGSRYYSDVIEGYGGEVGGWTGQSSRTR
jgi:hypothetical protein